MMDLPEGDTWCTLHDNPTWRGTHRALYMMDLPEGDTSGDTYSSE